MALKLDVLANTRQFTSEMKRAGASVEDISDTLDDLVKDGDRAGEKLESSFKEVARASQKTSDTIKREMKESSKVSVQALGNVKDEAGETTREVAASFDGSAESIAGGFQEIAANALNSFGIIGAVAGGVIAGGIGLVMKAITDQQAALDALKEKFADVYKTAAQEGRDYLTEAEIQSGVLEDLFDPTNNFEKRRKYEAEAAATGLSLIQIAEARNGSEEQINKALEYGSERVQQIQRDWEGLPGTISAAEIETQAVVDSFKQQQDIMKQNKQVAKEVGDQQKSSAQQAAAEINKVGDALRGLQPANIPIGIQDNTQMELYRIKRNIEGQVAYITVQTRLSDRRQTLE